MSLFRRPRPGMRTFLGFIALVLGWCGLWRDFSVANVLGGALVAALVLVLDVSPPGAGKVKVIPLMRFLGVVAADLVKSTIGVAAEILTVTDNTEEAIIEVTTPLHARHHLLLLVIAVTVTPGTAVVDADPDTGTLYLHILHYDQAAGVRRHIAQLVELADQALPKAGIAASTRTEVRP
ncbi:MAG: Na+/H+ antiporter subunit E [Actinomycetota bacterium]